jgi:hypothetical protein
MVAPYLSTEVQKQRGERRRHHPGDTCTMQDLSTEVQKQRERAAELPGQSEAA